MFDCPVTLAANIFVRGSFCHKYSQSWKCRVIYLFRNGTMLAQTAGKFSKRTVCPVFGMMLSWQFGVMLWALITVGNGAFRSSSPAIKSTQHLIVPKSTSRIFLFHWLWGRQEISWLRIGTACGVRSGTWKLILDALFFFFLHIPYASIQSYAFFIFMSSSA
jgi:hypothetical protein